MRAAFSLWASHTAPWSDTRVPAANAWMPARLWSLSARPRLYCTRSVTAKSGRL